MGKSFLFHFFAGKLAAGFDPCAQYVDLLGGEAWLFGGRHGVLVTAGQLDSVDEVAGVRITGNNAFAVAVATGASQARDV